MSIWTEAKDRYIQAKQEGWLLQYFIEMFLYSLIPLVFVVSIIGFIIIKC